MAVSRPITARPLAPFTAMLASTSPVLGQELDRERRECGDRMQGIIADALSREPFLSSSIFEEPAQLEAKLVASERALLALPDEEGRSPICNRTIRAIYQLRVRELLTAEALREARLAVGHADRPGYWKRRDAAWARGHGFQPDAL